MNPDSAPRRWLAIATWLIGAAVCAVLVYRTTFVSDLSAFLPQSPTPEQRVLLDQLRDGVVSRLILIGIEGGDAKTRAALSKETAGRLRDDPAFSSVANGQAVNAERDLAFLFKNRYLLSPAIDDAHFAVDALHAEIDDTVNTLTSPAGLLIKRLLPRDPTGETLRLLEQENGDNRPNTQFGVWSSRDGARALLLAQTRAAGVDIDAQQQAMQKIEHAFAAAKQKQDIRDPAIKLSMAGPGVFSVLSRDTIKDEVSRLAILSTLIIVSFLLLVYRSVTALVLGLFPVVSGALVGVAAVSLSFGNVHGLTLGFGTTLIGEAIDYSIYLFVQSRRAGASDAADWAARFWPTIRLGVLTSVVGFSTLLLSSFPGLAQLGLFTIAGLITAAAVTRFVLPQLLPEGFVIRDVTAIGERLAALSRHAAKLRRPVVLLFVLAAVTLVGYRATMWNPELSTLSPVPAADLARDASLRADLGASDSRYMIVVSSPDQESALQSSERIAAQLQPLVSEGVLAGFEAPSRYLPSVAAQQARQASLPVDALPERLTQAVDGLPVRGELFAPFLADVAAAKARPPLQRADLANTSFALALDSLLTQRGSRWNAILPLATPVKAGVPTEVPVAAVRRALAAAGRSNALFVDLKAESDNLYGGYLHEAVLLSMGGLIGIIVLLLVVLRSPLRVTRVVLPLLGAVMLVAAVLVVCGQGLTILHLVGLLLIVAVGSNYALFFNPKPASGPNNIVAISPQTLASLVFANLTTVAGFGLLGISQVPVLQAIGVTVGPGAVLALVLSAIFARGASGEAA
jgi:predicted exporter